MNASNRPGIPVLITAAVILLAAGFVVGRAVDQPDLPMAAADSATSTAAVVTASPVPTTEYEYVPAQSTPIPTVAEPYPPPPAGPVEPYSTPTADPDRANLTAPEWAELLAARLNSIQYTNPYIDGPVTVLQSADVYSTELEPWVSHYMVENGIVPDCVVIVSGSFLQPGRSQLLGPYSYCALVGDRGSDRFYDGRCSNDLAELEALMP